MTNEKAIKYLQQLYPNGGHCWLDEQRIEAIGMAVKALQKEPASEDLEQAIDTYLSTYFGGEKEKQEWPFLKKMAIHFAEWQKEQLMAKAVDGVVHRFDRCGVASVHYNDPNGVPMAYFISSEELSAGDKVKIITIKED